MPVQHPRGNLPTEVTSFVGRYRELTEVKKLLPEVRLLTLTGTGGVGKTRLALRVATQIRRAFPDGVWLVELAALQDCALLEQTVADAVGLGDQSGRVPREVLMHHLRDQRALLVLDNCEHLGAACGTFAGELLAAAPQLRILATSRHALRAPGERILPVPPLPVSNASSPDDHTPNDAVRLFGDRTMAVVPEFAATHASRAAIAEICQRLDGLPLAIELAAARIQTLSPEQILSRLDNRFRLLAAAASSTVQPRHQKLRSVLDWSYHLCSPSEQRLWARMSVFTEGCDLNTAEAVCSGDGIAPDDVLDGVTGLLDKSILAREEHNQGTEVRYRMLDTIRNYGEEMLRAAGQEETMLQRHCDYFLQLAERNAAEWFGPTQVEITARMRLEHANLRLALDYCLRTDSESQTGLRLASVLHFYWLGCGFLAEGRHWLDRMLASDTTPSRARATALWTAAYLAIAQGDRAAGVDMAAECWQWVQSHADQTMAPYALFALGIAEWSSGDLSRTCTLLEDALERFAALGELNVITIITYVSLSGALAYRGQLDHSLAVTQKAAMLCEQRGDRRAWTYALYVISLSEWLRGDSALATMHAQEALRGQQIFDDALGTVFTIECLAWYASSSGENERAAVLLGAAHRLYPAGGGEPLVNIERFRAAHDACQQQARRGLGDHKFQIAFNAGAEFEHAQAVSYALGQQAQLAPSPPAVTDDPLALLTRREGQVTELVAEGLSNKDIAMRLVISTRTAEGHVQNSMAKLGFTKRVQLAMWFKEQKHDLYQ